MIKVWQYSMYDLIRSRWTYIYFLFYLVTTMGLLHISNTLSMTIVSLVNIITILIPLIGTIFGAIYFYNSKEFIELLLAQPIQRSSIFLGQYLGLATSLAMSYSLGVGLPFLFRYIWMTDQLGNFINLLVVGVLLTFIFVGLAYLIALSNNNRMKGFGLAIIVWLFLAVIYDGLFILSLVVFEDYPLESFSLISSMLNQSGSVPISVSVRRVFHN